MNTKHGTAFEGLGDLSLLGHKLDAPIWDTLSTKKIVDVIGLKRKRGGQATIASHGDRLGNGGKAGGRGRGGMYIRQLGASSWMLFPTKTAIHEYLGLKQSAFTNRLSRGDDTSFRTPSGKFPDVTWEKMDGNGVQPDEWDWAEGHDPSEENEDEDGEGGEGGGA